MRKLILLFVLIYTPIFAQSSATPTYTISGKIIDSNTKTPLDYATVIFKNIDSSDIIFGGITNHRGNFSIDVQKGMYNATVEFISYKTKSLSLSAINKNVHIGAIEMEFTAESLQEIEISGKVNMLNIKQNKQVYNVTKDLSSNGASATQILSNIPSVSVGSNGNLTIRGQGNVRVLIDGKISSLSKSDALRSLPAGSIDKIEVIANPGASYRASASGIINIILKKGKNEGLNSSITASGGYKELYGGLLTFNHKSEKVNFFTTTSYAHSVKNTLIGIENEYFTNGITTGFLEENTKINSPSNDFMAIVGAEFYLSENSTLTATGKYDNIKRDPFSNSNSTFLDASQSVTISNFGQNDAIFKDEIFEFSLDLKHNFKNEGQQLSSYILYSNDSEYYVNDFTNSNPIFVDDFYIEENKLDNSEVSIKYTHPLNETSSFELGYLGTFGKTHYKLTEETIQENINYLDNIHGVFLEYEKSWDSFYLGAGLRAEFTELITEFEHLNTEQKNNFNDFFPSIYLEYTISDYNSLSLSYSRTIKRPGYYELRPYEQKISETTSYIGNINLTPTYFNSTNFSYNYYGNKLTFVSAIYWNNYESLFQPISYETLENGIPKIVTTIENIGELDMYGISLIANMQASKWLDFIGSANLYKMDQTGIFEYKDANDNNIIKDFESVGFSGDFSLLTKFTIPNVFDFQFNVINQLASEGAYSKREANTYVNAAIKKELFNNNASLSLSVDDVFNSRKTNRTWFEPNYNSHRTKAEKYQTIVLSFTYRFNQDKQNRSVNFDKKQNKPQL
ncbi:MAG: TonB-dependent receptor [Bacteroidetes bacterium]|nr:TonB-dependent receptor [Bacteroidota bacterium]